MTRGGFVQNENWEPRPFFSFKRTTAILEQEETVPSSGESHGALECANRPQRERERERGGSGWNVHPRNLSITVHQTATELAMKDEGRV